MSKYEHEVILFGFRDQMKVSDVMVKKVIVADEDEKLSTVFDKMEKYRIHQIPLVNDNRLLGMVVLKNLLNATYIPHKTEANKFKVSVTPLNADDGLDDAVYKIIGSGFKALPVVEDDYLQGMVSVTELIKHVEYPKDIYVGKLTDNVIVIRDEDNVSKALSLMSENGISRLPVVDYEDKVLGCIDVISLIKFLRSTTESPRPSDLTAVEKRDLKGFKVKDFMRDAYMMEANEFSIKNAVNALQSHEEIIVTSKGVPVGIVTSKDLLELATKGDERFPIHVSRFERIDPMMYGRFEGELNNFTKKFSKMFDIQNFYVYVDEHKVGSRGKYSLRARLVTGRKVFPVHSHAWDLMDATHMLLDKLEKQLLKYHEKGIKSRRGRTPVGLEQTYQRE